MWEQSETEGERVGGEIKRNKSEKGVEPARETEEVKGVKEKGSMSDCFTGSF